MWQAGSEVSYVFAESVDVLLYFLFISSRTYVKIWMALRSISTNMKAQMPGKETNYVYA